MLCLCFGMLSMFVQCICQRMYAFVWHSVPMLWTSERIYLLSRSLVSKLCKCECLNVYIVFIILQYMSVIMLCYLFKNIYTHSTVPCGYRFANMYKLSVIVIDKPIGLGGTISTCKSIYSCHIYVPYITKIKDLKLLHQRYCSYLLQNTNKVSILEVQCIQ